MKESERIEQAIQIAMDYSQYDGSRHKMQVIDQTVRELLGNKYEEWVKKYCDGEDGPNTYEWNIGIAP